MFGKSASYTSPFALATLNGSNGFLFSGPGNSSNNISDGSGDINGDGYNDILVVDSPSSGGDAYFIFGAASFSATFFVRLIFLSFSCSIFFVTLCRDSL